MNELRARRIRLAGIGTRLVEGGHAGASEAVLLLHGNPGSAEDWAYVQPHLSGLGWTIALDLPGFGQAERPGDWDYSPVNYAAFIGAAVDELGLERVHLVMHDLGGLGLLWAVNSPDRFASCVLINTGNLVDFRWHVLARLYRTRGIGEILVSLGGRALFRLAIARLNPQPRPLPDACVDRMASDYDRGTRRAAMRFYRETPAEAMGLLAPMLRPLDRPALVIWGRHDPFIPMVQAELQRESFPGAVVELFEESGHWPHLDNPARVTHLMERFLRGQLAGC